MILSLAKKGKTFMWWTLKLKGSRRMTKSIKRQSQDRSRRWSKPIKETQVNFITHISLLSIFILEELLTVLQGEIFLASVEQLTGIGFGHKWYQ